MAVWQEHQEDLVESSMAFRLGPKQDTSWEWPPKSLSRPASHKTPRVSDARKAPSKAASSTPPRTKPSTLPAQPAPKSKTPSTLFQ